MKRMLATLVFLTLIASAANAKGIVVGFGVMHGVADLAAKETTKTGVNGAFKADEIGGRFEYWNFMGENYALNFAANVGFSSETDEVRSDAPVGTKEAKFSTSSWSVRLGGDRTWNPLPNTTLFMGPGIEYWTGKAKFEEIYPPGGTYETESTTRISLHGHTGGIMMMGPNWGISGQLGHKLGMASAEEGGAKTTWWPNSIDGSMQLVFKFGGN